MDGLSRRANDADSISTRAERGSTSDYCRLDPGDQGRCYDSDGMGHKFDPSQRARLSSPERLALLPIPDVIGLSAVKEGDRVLDIGCGPGVFTIPLARAVGVSGRVHAYDIEETMVEECRARVAGHGLTNVAVGRSEENRTDLPSESIDLIFACHLLHELTEPALFFDELRRIARPGGRLAAVEWEKIETGIGPPVNRRFTPDDTQRLLASGGWTAVSRHSITWGNYMVLARRP